MSFNDKLWIKYIKLFSIYQPTSVFLTKFPIDRCYGVNFDNRHILKFILYFTSNLYSHT